jgi:hypothetical protein
MTGPAWRVAATLTLVFVSSWPALRLIRPLSAQEALSLDAEIDTAPVERDGEVLFRVRGSSSLAASTRAANVRARLEAVARNRSLPLTSLRIAEVGGFAQIVAGDRPIVAITEADARLEQLTRSELAQIHLARIRQAIDEYRQARTLPALQRSVRDATGAAVAFLAGVGVLFFISRWVHRLTGRRPALAAKRVEPHDRLARIRAVAMRGPERLASALHQGVHLATALVFIILSFSSSVLCSAASRRPAISPTICSRSWSTLSARWQRASSASCRASRSWPFCSWSCVSCCASCG